VGIIRDLLSAKTANQYLGEWFTVVGVSDWVDYWDGMDDGNLAFVSVELLFFYAIAVLSFLYDWKVPSRR